MMQGRANKDAPGQTAKHRSPRVHEHNVGNLARLQHSMMHKSFRDRFPRRNANGVYTRDDREVR